MKRIAYAEEWLTTDDRVADLVLEYARALAQHDTADTISVPVLDDDGRVRQAQFLVGPASQIIIIEAETDAPSFAEADAAVADLRARIERLAPHAVPFDEGDDEAAALSDY
jgi:hypothetical protein